MNDDSKITKKYRKLIYPQYYILMYNIKKHQFYTKIILYGVKLNLNVIF